MLNTKAVFRLVTMIVTLSLACNFVTGFTGGGGPNNFTAVLTAPDVVMLKWDAIEGATEYILELSIENGDFVPIVALPPDRTSYEDLTAPQKSSLTYQVQVVIEAGPAGKSQVSITTNARQPNPSTVSPAYDEENAAVSVVGTQGGTLSAVDSNGVEYTLDIPVGALYADTEIRMTAVTAIGDWPLDGASIGAVRLEPEGLVLNDVAILTIGIPVEVEPGLTLVGFAFQADGQEFHLQQTHEENGLTDLLPSSGAHLASPVFQTPVRRIVLPVMELKAGGVGQASSDSVSQYAKDHAPSDAGAALEQKWAAEAIADDELAPLTGLTDPVSKQAYLINQAISEAKNCKELNSQIVSFQKWRYSTDYLGLSDDQRRAVTKQIWDDLTDKVKEVLENAATECEKSSEPGNSAATDSPCAKALLEKITNPPAGTVSDFNLDLKNKLENKLSNKELQDIKDKLDKCKAAYRIVGGLDDWQTDTAVCDIMKPFKLTSDILTVDFSGGLSGTYSYSGGPFGAAGGSRYTISLPNGVGKPGTMTGGGVGCAEGKCEGGTEIYDLTPISPETPCTQ